MKCGHICNVGMWFGISMIDSGWILWGLNPACRTWDLSRPLCFLYGKLIPVPGMKSRTLKGEVEMWWPGLATNARALTWLPRGTLLMDSEGDEVHTRVS